MYLAPTEDMQFLIDDVLDVGGVLGALPQYAELGLGPDLTTALLDEAAKFAADVVSPLRRVGDAHPADALLPALLESLDASKAPRAKTGVLEFALYVLSGQGGGTDPTGRGRAPATAGGAALRRWVARVAPLTADKHGPLRAAAASSASV